MKANYIKPSTTLVEIHSGNLLNITSNGDGTKNITGGGDFNESTTEKLSRRGGSFWNDDEGDDY